jgi:16S rRNA (uracil1498-N3)-methyltransferase
VPKYFFNPNDLNKGDLTFRNETAHHLLQVLRLKPGAQVTLCDGKNSDYTAVLREADAKRMVCRLDVSEPIPCETEAPVFTTLYQALPKGDKMELIIQKCVELGVGKIVPLYTAHTLAKNAEKKTERYQRIAESAAEQSMRGIIPEVTLPQTFAQILAKKKNESLWLVALSPLEFPKSTPIKTLAKVFRVLVTLPASIGLWVGPEGGFSPEEVSALLTAGAVSFTLGQRVLRTETAGLAALAQINCLTE